MARWKTKGRMNIVLRSTAENFKKYMNKHGQTKKNKLSYYDNMNKQQTLGVLGFLSTTRSFSKIPNEVRSLPKTSEVCRRRSSRENA